MAGFCDITDALAEAQYYVLRRINNKFEALRRLGELLEQLGDLSNLIPQISQLIPVIDIDLSIYTNLRSNCPFLNLPAADETSLENLRNQVITAYSTLTAGLLNHPWMRMGKLQDQLSKYQQKVNAAFAEGGQYIQCLQAACQAAQQTGQFLTRVSQADIANEFSRYGRNFVDNAGQVLNESALAKYDQTVAAVNQMKSLGAEVAQDYSTAKAAVTTTTTTSSSTTTADSPNTVTSLP